MSACLGGCGGRSGCSVKYELDDGSGSQNWRALFYDFRELLLKTPVGKKYVDRYYKHFLEIGSILMNDRNLQDEVNGFFKSNAADLQLIVANKGEKVVFNESRIDNIRKILQTISEPGSKELKQTIKEIEKELLPALIPGRTAKDVMSALQL
ncbi:MAG: hypothetical protein GY866_08150 [Proteobacteria bacterium]|nr:hypothetical protein [Pseudomonadota bacterium]